MEEKREHQAERTGEDAEIKSAEKREGGKGTAAASTGRTGRNGSGRTGSAGRTEEAEQSEKSVELPEVKQKEKPAEVPVILPTMTAEEKKKEAARIRAKKARDRKKAEKEAAEKKAAGKDMFNNEQLTTLLVTLSAVLAARPGCGHWQLSQMEAQQIINPLCNIVKANTKIEDLGKYADHIALTIACVTILVPRLIVTVQQMQADRAKKKEVMNNGNIKAGAITESDGHNGGKHHTEQHDSPDVSAGILADLATAGF